MRALPKALDRDDVCGQTGKWLTVGVFRRCDEMLASIPQGALVNIIPSIMQTFPNVIQEHLFSILGSMSFLSFDLPSYQ
jgi:hypothetical protein